MLRTFLASLFLFSSIFFPVITTPIYAEEAVVEQIETFPKEGTPEEYLDEETAPQRQVIDVRALFFKTLLLLVGLCGLVVAGGYFFKRLTGGRLSSLSTNGEICLIERKYLSPKTSVWLIEARNQSLVVVDSQYGVAVHSLRENPPQEDTIRK
jgi:flagellar biogenesis protein FliO